MGYVEMSKHIPVWECDYYKDGPEVAKVRKTFVVEALAAGQVQAILFHWKVWMNKKRTISISTNPREHDGNLPRYMNWGQGIQLVEDPAGFRKPLPVLLEVKKGQRIEVLIETTSVDALRARITKVHPASCDKR